MQVYKILNSTKFSLVLYSTAFNYVVYLDEVNFVFCSMEQNSAYCLAISGDFWLVVVYRVLETVVKLVMKFEFCMIHKNSKLGSCYFEKEQLYMKRFVFC